MSENITEAEVIDSTADDVSIPGEEAPPVGAELELVEVTDPASGEVINLRDLEPIGLARTIDRVDRLVVDVAAFRRALVDAGAHMLDRLNARKDRVGEYELETNAPTSVEYREDVLLGELVALVAAGVIEAKVIDKVFKPQELPKEPPPPKLDKRELNKLKSNERAAAAIARASVRTNNRRTLKVTRIKGEAPDA